MTNILSPIFGKGMKPCILVSLLTKRFETTGSLMVISNLQGRGEHTCMSVQCCVRKHNEREARKDDHVAFSNAICDLCAHLRKNVE